MRTPLLASTLVLAAAAHAAELPADSPRALRHSLRDAHAAHDGALAPHTESVQLDEARAARLSEGVAAYVALALEQSPEVRGAFERWEASVHRVARARTLPEPTVGFGLFLQSVETRVGPQQARLSLQQAFPWPATLTAGAGAASDEARGAQQRFEASALGIARQVEQAYWTLWELRQARATHRDHLEVLDGLSATVGARLAVGAASLADLQQIDLSRARLADGIASMDQRESALEAQLAAAVGLRATRPLPTAIAPPDPALPADSRDALLAAALDHPMLASMGYQAEAADNRVRQAASRRMPSATVGADWILTGEAVPVMGPVEDSGKDAVIVGVGLRLPLWQGSYSKDIASERAMADALRADQRAMADRSSADLDTVLSAVRDSARRAEVSSGTLLPQAEAAYTSILGGYASGGSAVAQVLLAQRDLLDLRVEQDRALADHARAWAALQERCGRSLDRVPATPLPEVP